MTLAQAQKVAIRIELFNEHTPVGTTVEFWRGYKLGHPSGVARTAAAAELVGDEAAVLLSNGAVIPLDHIELLEPDWGEAA